jgi:phospholipase/lecithinase/hemolysin
MTVEDTMFKTCGRRQFYVLPAVLATLTLTLGTADPDAAVRPYERIVVFGTSLSDSGNAFGMRGGTSTPPDYLVDPFLVPSAPYANGGHHFSNGATWVEQFARSVGLAASAHPAFRGAGNGATNYAVGAARARNDGTNFNLSDQVTAFLQDFGGVAPSDALYVIEMGGNDVRDALVAFSQGQNGAAIIQAAVQSIAQNLTILYSAGARNFLIWSVPNIGLTPAIRTLGPGVAAFAGQLSAAFNTALSGALIQLSAALPGIQIARLDAFTLIGEIVADPSGFGLTDVTSACITPGVTPFTCENADDFLFWDGIHPTKVAHGIVAQEAASVLAVQ